MVSTLKKRAKKMQKPYGNNLVLGWSACVKSKWRCIGSVYFDNKCVGYHCPSCLYSVCKQTCVRHICVRVSSMLAEVWKGACSNVLVAVALQLLFGGVRRCIYVEVGDT